MEAFSFATFLCCRTKKSWLKILFILGFKKESERKKFYVDFLVKMFDNTIETLAEKYLEDCKLNVKESAFIIIDVHDPRHSKARL